MKEAIRRIYVGETTVKDKRVTQTFDNNIMETKELKVPVCSLSHREIEQLLGPLEKNYQEWLRNKCIFSKCLFASLCFTE